MSHQQANLRARARERLDSGQLPTEEPMRSYAGQGTARQCHLCDALIVSPDIEFELDFQAADGCSYLTILLHAGCRAIWDAERRGARDAPARDDRAYG